ncbi:MAG: hypothetical protein GY870_11535, partial [archaeon]|nr:hypothetical protein [archaeon]
ASGLNKSSINLWYEVGGSGDLSGASKISSFSESVEDNRFDFVIQDEDYSVGNTVYFKINGSDYNGNWFNTGVSSFNVIDNVVPLLSINHSLSNFTSARFDLDVSMMINASDYISGEIDSLLLFVKNGGPASYYGVNCVKVEYNSHPYSDIYEFIIEYPLLSDELDLYYYIIANDSVDNRNEINGSFSVAEKASAIFYLPLPAEEKYYYNTPIINLSFVVNFECDLSYKFDDNNIDPMVFGNNYSCSYIFNPETDEGLHNLTIFYSKYQENFEFILDFTPTSSIKNFKTEYLASFVELSWDAPDDADNNMRYEIYRAESENGEYEFIHRTSGLSFREFHEAEGNILFYKVIAIDRAGNKSESKYISIQLPLPFYIWGILISLGIVGVVSIVKIGSIISNKRMSRNFTEMLSENLEENVIMNNGFKTVEKEEKIQWKKVSLGTEIANNGNYEVEIGETRQVFWYNNVEIMVQEASKLEIDGNRSQAIKMYKIALRSAENDSLMNSEVIEFLRQKLLNIYYNPLDQHT